MTTFLVALILFLGLVNVVRMAVFMILGDWYGIYMKRKLTEKRSRSGTYQPFVSVVIPAYNEERSIVRTIRSVLRSTYKNFEIIIVDDGSTDKTARKVTAVIARGTNRNVTLVRQSNGGKARALNRGIRYHAGGSLIMTLDADSLIAPDGLSRAVAYFRNPRIKAVASNVRILKSQTVLGLIQYIEYLVGYRLKQSYTVLQMEYIIGGIGSTFRKNVLRQVGFYDTDTVTEDIDVTMKIVREGNKAYQVVYGDDVLTFTQPVSTFPDLLRQRFRWKFGRFQTMFKNKHMFFRPDPRYTKLLTYFQLPFVLYSELTFLIDPLLVGFIFYVSYLAKESQTVLWMFLFFAFYTSMTIIADPNTRPGEKVWLLVLSPLAYLFFFVISIVEYVALWKCIIGFRGILKAREINSCSWEHVERVSVPA